MQKSARTWALALLATAIALIVSTIPAQAIDLNAGRRLTTSSTNPSRSKISFKFTNDPGLFSGDSPICPTQTKIRFVTNLGPMPEQVLPCNGWSLKGSGFQFKDIPAAGSLRKVSYGPGRLAVTLKGFPYGNNPVIGPINFIETRVTIGTKAYCGRWDEPPGDVKKNTPSRIVIKGPTTACVFACGNSILEPDEACDDGDLVSGDGCDSNCTPTGCGNGIQTAGEQCDDGDNQSGDGCSATCVIEGCGDGIQTAGEQCDDGNAVSGDCCSSTCQLEAAGSECGSDGNVCTNDQCNGAGVCLHSPNSSPCDDGDGCTASDVCSGGSCGGTLLEPWVNEIDYDNNSIGNDTNEFIELAGPAGKNLSGYQVVVVEGGNALCLTGGSAGGQAYSIGILPNGTILPDDTGSGIGFLVVCFAGSSSAVPGCDVTLPGDATATNLKDGSVLNVDETACADGVALLTPGASFVDAVSYEGIVANAAPFGTLFHVTPPYSAPRDDGGLAGVSIEKTSSTLARATSASEWRDPSELGSILTCQNQVGLACPTNTWTPGAENPLQVLFCPITMPYGSPSAAFLNKPTSLID